MRIDLNTACRILREADDIVILTHSKPDGDTIGSGFALWFALRGLGKRVRVRCPDPFPDKYSFLYERYNPPEFEEKFVVTTDVASTRLLAGLEQVYAGRIDLCIDHHLSNELYAAHSLVDDRSPAASQTMYHVIRGLGVTPGVDIANALYTGIVTDTGGFRYADLTPETHRIAAELIELGAEFYEINRRAFETKSRGRIAVEGLVFQSMTFHYEGLCACVALPNDIWTRFSVRDEDMEGVSALPRSVEGVLAGITIFEGKKGNCRVSLRTFGEIDASNVCMALGGGGHRNAAGCTVPGTTEQVRERVLRGVGEELERNGYTGRSAD